VRTRSRKRRRYEAGSMKDCLVIYHHLEKFLAVSGCSVTDIRI